MARDQKLLFEMGIVSVFIAFWWFFIQTNVSPALGNVYIGLTVSAVAIALIDSLYGTKEIKLVNPSNDWVTVAFVAVIGYLVLIFGGKFIISLTEVIPISEILNLLASSAPVFSQSAIINYITFAIVIAYIETYALFIVGYDLLASMFKVRIDKSNLTNPKLWLIIFGISLLFLMLHVTAKGIDNQSTLVIVFFMAVISLVLTTIYKDGRPALILHILANGIASASLFGVINPITIIAPLIGG